MRLNAKTGKLIGVKVVNTEDELMVITAEGIILRQDVAGISKQGRSAQGVKAMRIKESKVVAIAKVVNKEDGGDSIEETELTDD